MVNIYDDIIDKKIDVTLDKRNKMYDFFHQELIGEKYSPDKMVFGDISFCQGTRYFIDKMAYEDNVYYLFALAYNGIEYYVPEICSKDSNSVPDEVKKILFGNIWTDGKWKLNQLVKKAFEDKSKESK